MKTKRLLMTLLMALLVPWAAMAQQSLPYTEDFESYSSGLPTGWTKVGSGTVAVQTTSSQVHQGSVSLKFSGATSNVVALPQFAKEINKLQISLYSKAEGNYSSCGSFDVGYVTNLTDASTFVQLQSDDYSSFTSYGSVGPVSMASAPDGAYIALRHRPSSTYYYWFVDDIYVEELPACPYPSNLQASGVTHEEATITWTSDESAWQIVWSNDENFDPDAATPTPITAKSYTITGLTAQTDYYVYVRSNCTASNNGYSDWSSKLHFKTTAQAEAVGDGWSDDFEGASCGWELINGTLTNQWAWGTAANNGGTHGLYISNDGGTSNAYSHSAAIVYATKLLNFTEGKYEFSYDWKANGESTYDYLRVALVPATVTLTAGTIPSGFSTTVLPSGWIALDGGSKLNLVTAWQSKSLAIDVTAGNYYLVMAWRNDGGGGTQPPAAVDNVSITRVACPYDVTDLAVSNITTTGATLTWTAGEATQWQVAYATTNNFEGATEEIVSAATYPMTSLTDGTHYYVRVRAYCGGSDYGSWSNVVEFDTKCLPTTVSSEGWTENFDDLTVASAYTAPTTRVLPLCWSAINTSTYSTYEVFPTVYYYSSTNYSHSTPNCLKFYSYYSSFSNYDPQPQYAILPEMDNLAGMRIKLWARGYNATSTFKIGRMTDPEDASTFVQIGEEHGFTSENYQTYQEITVELTGTGNYIAIMIDAANSSRSTNGVYIDDIRVEPIPSCTEPSDLECTATTTTTATLHWTAGGTETTWDIYVSTENVAPTNSTTPTVGATADNPATVPSLTAATKYYAWVRAHCSDSDQSPWVGGISFTTDCETVTTFPFVQDFNSLATNGEIPVCWDNTDGTTTNTNYKWCYYNSTSTGGTTGTGHNNTNCIRFESYNNSNGYTNFLKTPVMNLPAGKVMQLNFWYKNPAGGDFSVFISTDGGTTYTTALATNLRYQSSWAEKEIVLSDYVGTENVVIVFKGTSNYGNGDAYIYLDDVVIAEAPTCIKPSALKCDSKTAHTATLSWTNGVATQDAWQIAYSTTADFDPNSVTPVDVTTNPATIEGLSQSTTYYAYVRANCGGDDYSAWCNNKVTFSTVAGNVTPTGLAVDASNISSSEATATWNAVAGNTLHEYYQIYWAEATVTSVPDEPAAPNLITNITATSQLISGLNPETSYKVWVRDICGDDGNSAWSTTPVTFTTAASCQLPDGLAESEVTATSAKITWNTYGQTSFNLQYSSDEGATWTTVPNVNSPYTFPNNLTANTAYQVQVQATCNTEEWSTVLSFRTECDAITITDSYSYTEDFEDPVTTSTYSSMTGLEVPYCWDNYTTYTSYAYARPHIIKEDAQYNYASSGQVLYFYGSGSGYAELPEFTNAINTLQISFKWATESSSNGSLTLGYITNEDDGTYNTFTAIGESFDASNGTSYQNLKSETVYLNAVPASATRLVFRWYYSGQWGANIDDIEVSLLPSCYPVGTLSYDATSITSSSVKLSWALIDDTQTAWDVAYKMKGETDFTIVDNVNTHENYILGGLTPEKEYTVKVRANCGSGDYGTWSNEISFTTDLACPAPRNLAVSHILPTSAQLNWTSESDSYVVMFGEIEAIVNVGFEDNQIPGSFTNDAYYPWTVVANTHSGAYCAKSASGNDSETSALELEVTLTYDAILTFSAKVSSEANYDKAYFSIDGTNKINAISGAGEWIDYEYPLAAGTHTLRWYYTKDSSFASNDDCFYVDDIVISGVTSWSESNAVTTTSYTFGGTTALTPSTSYQAKVKAVCGGIDGETSAPIAFTTLPDAPIINGGNWNNINEWVPGTTTSIPEGEDVIINGDVTIPANVTAVADTIIIADGGSITIEEGGQLIHSNPVPVTMNFTIPGWNNAKSGNNEGYILFAMPLYTDETNLTTPVAITNMVTGAYDLYYFNQAGDTEGKEWINYRQGAFPFEIGKGYLYANENQVTPTLTGTAISTDDREQDLAYTDGKRLAGWNLIGNPFTCNAYIGQAFYRLNSNGSEVNAETETGAIAPMEGVFVLATGEGQTVTFTKNAPQTANSSISANLSSGSQLIDRAIIRFGNESQLPKFMLNPNNTKIYIPMDDMDYAVVNAGNVGEMPVSFKAAENGSYTLSFTSQEVTFSYLHLIDNLTGNDVDLLANPSYSFDAQVTDYAQRFRLVFATGSSVDGDSFAFINGAGNLSIFGIEGTATVQVMDVTGRILSSDTFSGSYEKQLNAAAGVYVIRLINGDDVKVQKIVVR